MKSLFYLFAGFTLLTLLTLSCREVIEFEPPDTIKNAIFIEGKLTKGNPSFVQVKIGRVFDFATNPSLFLADFVEVIDERGTALSLNTRQQGIFTLAIPSDHPTFQVNYGEAFKIRLQLKNGSIYESALDTLYPVPILGELTKEKAVEEVRLADGTIIEQTIGNFNVSTVLDVTNSKFRPHLMWELEAVYKQSDTPTSIGRPPCVRTSVEPKTCFVSFNPVENYRVLNTRNLSGDAITDYTVFEARNLNTFVFAEGYYLTVFQQSLSSAAFEYWEQANLLTNRNGSIFEQPSGKIITNFRNIDNAKDEVYGFFFATESSFKRIYVSPEFADNPGRSCPSPLPPPSPVCINCLCQANSTTVKPDWWEE